MRSLLLLSLLLCLGQLLWPVQVLASPGHLTNLAASVDGAFVAVPQSVLDSLTGGCVSNCDGDDDDDGGSGGDDPGYPSPVGSPYWEASGRRLISRPDVYGSLVWERINSTNQEWGPFDVKYQFKEEFNWSIGGSVPSSVVRGDLGSSRLINREESMRLYIPAKTKYKLYVAYPYERWEYSYSQYQDYDDGTRDRVGSGTATAYDQWTRTNLVDSPVP